MQEKVLTSEKQKNNLFYWKNRIPGNMDPTNIRLDFHRPVEQSNEFGSIDFLLDQDITRSILRLANDEPFLVYTLLLTGLQICLYKYSENPTIVVGSPLLNTAQQNRDTGGSVVIINSFKDTSSFKDLLMIVRSNLLEAYERQDYLMEELLRELEIEKSENRCSLFNIALGLTNIHEQLPELKNDITITFTLEENRLFGKILFNVRLFWEATLQQFLTHYTQVLRQAIQNVEIGISDIILLTQEEKQELLVEWNDTDTDYPENVCIHQLFEEQAEKKPDSIALVYGTQRLTYGELNTRANQVAHYVQRLGIKPDMMVGLFIDRSIEMIVGLLGVLKSGGAYVPLDPSYPKDRILSMLNAARFPVILTKESLVHKLPENSAKIVCLDRDWEEISKEGKENMSDRVSVHNLCYVIFTSGSTGIPKGATVLHQGWTNLLHWFTKEFSIDARDRNLIISSFSFDITQRAIAMSLINGGELHLLKSDYYEPQLILDTIGNENITLLNCSPSTFYPLIEDERQNFERVRSLRWLFLGGEAISASRLKSWTESHGCQTRVANVYGAAECTDVSSFYVLRNHDRYIRSSVPVGIPIYNSQVYILNQDLEPVPRGLVGEICIAGVGVGRGYINDEDLTKAKFVQNPFEPGEKLYRTGDLGRFLPDSNIELIGRVDYQVKIRGFRIELGDIEAVLRQNPLIKESAVIDKMFAQNDHRLIAYLVPQKRSSTVSEKELINALTEFSKEKLPAYMVPNIFIVIDELPLSPNGKVDRKALPLPDGVFAKEEESAAYSPLESSLIDIFAQTLKVDRVGIDDNFFELGGHSLLATQAVSSINESLKVKLSTADILANPTVKRLAKRIEERIK